MADDFSLEGLRRLACERLAHAVDDPTDPFHWPVFGTVDESGGPALRTVVLRTFDPTAGRLLMFTDGRSPKCHQLQPAASWLFYDTAQRLQVRADGPTATLRDEAERQTHFDTAKRSLADYAGVVPPSHAISGPRNGDAPSPVPETEAWANFTVVETRLATLEVLLLRKEGHLRARYRWSPPEATWLAP